MRPLPKHLILELTTKCNYRCPFCYCVWHEFPELAKRNLATAAWKKILRRCAEAGAEQLLFTGGEALLRPDLRELLAFARDLLPNGVLSLFTNASRLTEEFLSDCRTRRIRLATSLPGLAAYGAQTGTRRSCRRTLEWIARAAELHWPMSVNLTATGLNRHEFLDMYSAAVLSGPSSIRMSPMMAGGRGRGHLELALSRAEWETLKAQIRALPNRDVPYAFGDEMICECRPQPEALLRQFGTPSGPPCTAGVDFGVIGPSGKFRNCLHSVQNCDL